MTITLDNIMRTIDALKEARAALESADPLVRGGAQAACTVALIDLEIALKRVTVNVVAA